MPILHPKRPDEPERGSASPRISVPPVPDRPYELLPMRAQVHRLRQVALAALEHYPFEVSRLRLLLHAYNTSFRVDTVDGRRFAMRINTNSLKSEANLDAELAWLDALARDADVIVPAPQRTNGGRLRTNVWFEPVQRALPVVVMSWLPGRDLGDGPPEGFHALGRTMALLHEHALGWNPPTGFELESHAKVLFDLPNILVTDHPLLTGDSRRLFAEAMTRCQAAYDVAMRLGPVIPMHADLHGDNAKWYRGRLAVFDFDDAAVGAPVQDLAISAYYLRDDAATEDALLSGYEAVRPLPDLPPDEFEAIVAARNLLLVNEVLRMSTAEMREIAPRFVANSVLRLRSFMETGVYRRDIPGTVPLRG